MRMTSLLCAGVLLLTTGCAQTVWMHRDHDSQSRFEQDQRECQYDSVKYGQAQGYYQTGVGAGFADAMRKNEVLMACMQSKGYYLENIDKAREIRAQQVNGSTTQNTAAPKNTAAITMANLLGARLKTDDTFGMYYADVKAQDNSIIVLAASLWDGIDTAKTLLSG